MKKMLITASQPDELRVAITDNGLLVDLDIEKSGIQQKKSNIYKGKITSIEQSLAAVFVDYGSDRHGFLPLKEISPEYFRYHDSNRPIEGIEIKKLLKIGQPVVVQVQKEERGTKGAALTTYLSLAGSYLVLMPNSPRAGGISRRIEGEDRQKLRETLDQLTIPSGMGVIIRTAGVNKSLQELQWDLDILLRYFEALKQAVSLNKAKPYLIHQESDMVIRTLRDYLRQDIGEIIIDNESAYQSACNYIQQTHPDFINKLKLYDHVVPLFSQYQIEQQIETSYQHEIRLPSGGSVVIDQTEALVAIDINSSKATKGKSIEETAVNTNREATEEIARQLRFRDIGGLIVIDFIDMLHSSNQREIENMLRHYLYIDRARIQIGRISKFGLLEMSRQRLRSGLNKANRITCPRCKGVGNIRSVESLALSIVHLMQERSAKAHHQTFQLHLPVDVATFLLNELRDKIIEIEQMSNVKLVVVPNPHIKTPHYSIRQVKNQSEGRVIGEGNSLPPSYKLLRSANSDVHSSAATSLQNGEKPMIKQFLSDDTSKRPSKQKTKFCFIRCLLNRLHLLMQKPKAVVSYDSKTPLSQVNKNCKKQLNNKEVPKKPEKIESKKPRHGQNGGQRRKVNHHKNQNDANALIKGAPKAKQEGQNAIHIESDMKPKPMPAGRLIAKAPVLDNEVKQQDTAYISGRKIASANEVLLLNHKENS